MRTTLTIHDEIADALKKQAFETGKSFKDTVNDILQAGLVTAHLPHKLSLTHLNRHTWATRLLILIWIKRCSWLIP